MIQLGISAFFHDSAACLVKNGKVVAAAEEERFTEIKHDSSFPTNAINWLLEYTNTSIDDIDVVCWYEDPVKKDKWWKITFVNGEQLHTKNAEGVMSIIHAIRR